MGLPSRLTRPRLSYANIVATAALIVAVVGAGGGEAIAKAVTKLAPNSVTTTSIKKNAVTGAKIKDRSITEYDIAKGRLGGTEIKDRSLGGIDIANLSLGGQQIAYDSVAGNRIVPGSIDSYRIAKKSLTGDTLSDGVISNDKISQGTIGFEKFSSDAKSQAARLSSAEPMIAGSAMTGYGAIAYVTGDPSGSGDADVRTVSFSFPHRTSGLADFAGAEDSEHCAGSAAGPSAAPGWLCYYVKPDPGGANHVGDLEMIGQDSRGFALKYTPPAGAGVWTFAEIVWIYTAPNS